MVPSYQPSEMMLGFCSEVQINLEQKPPMTCQPWNGIVYDFQKAMLVRGHVL